MHTIAHIWDDYLSNSFVEVHPFLKGSTEYRSINIVQTLRDNGEKTDDATFYMQTGPMADILNPSFYRRVRNALSRRVRQKKFLRFSRDTLLHEKAALIHVHFGFTAGKIIPILRHLGLPSVVTFYGSDASAALRSSFWRARYVKMFPHISLLLVLCDAVKKRLVSLGCAPEKIIVWNLPAGVEKYPYNPRPRGTGLEFIMAARFTEKKGHSVLLKAFRKVRSQRPQARLTLIGYGNAKDQILGEIAELGIADFVRVIDTKMQGDFTKLYNEELKSKHIFVLPSTTAKNGDDEGGPSLTLVYAQAAGLPVITTHFPGSEITVKDHETGLFFQDDNVDDLTDKMLMLSNKPDAWDTYGKLGSDLAMQEFSEATQMKKLLSFYSALINHRKIPL